MKRMISEPSYHAEAEFDLPDLQDEDASVAKKDKPDKNSHDVERDKSDNPALIDRMRIQQNLSAYGLQQLLDTMTAADRDYLLKNAFEVRKQHYGNTVYVRGLIELTNYCIRDCAYCGIRRSNRHADRYRLSPETILEACAEGYHLGFRTFVLQGGEDPYLNESRMLEIIAAIRTMFPDCAITLSIGEWSKTSYVKFFQAGADRYLLRHETASRALYGKIHPDGDFDGRRGCLRDLKDIGFQTGAGFMVGLPGQTTADFVQDLLFLKELDPHMVGIGPFIPHKDTPLVGNPAGTVDKTLTLLAMVRLLLPEVLLPATTALGTIDPFGREKAYSAGANVIMPNLTPTTEKYKYTLYEGKAAIDDPPAKCLDDLRKKTETAGFVLDMQVGDHRRWQHAATRRVRV